MDAPSPRALRCVITSPDGLVFEGDARSVVVPAVDGEMGFLPRHAPLVGALGSGEARVERAPAGDRARFFLEGGFVQVLGGQVTILAASAEPADPAARPAAEARLEALLKSPPARGAAPEERDEHARQVEAARRRVRVLSRG